VLNRFRHHTFRRCAQVAVGVAGTAVENLQDVSEKQVTFIQLDACRKFFASGTAFAK
jgi:hypothetical protein